MLLEMKYLSDNHVVEHPYGIIKRQWGFYYIMTKKTIKRASADVGMMFTAFNLRRLINIIGKNEFKKYLEGLILICFSIFLPHQSKSSNIGHLNFNHLPSPKNKSRLKCILLRHFYLLLINFW